MQEVVAMTEDVAGRPCDDDEAWLLNRLVKNAGDFLHGVIERESWKQYPAEVLQAVEQDPQGSIGNFLLSTPSRRDSSQRVFSLNTTTYVQNDFVFLLIKLSNVQCAPCTCSAFNMM